RTDMRQSIAKFVTWDLPRRCNNPRPTQPFVAIRSGFHALERKIPADPLVVNLTSRWRPNELQCQFQRHTEMLICSSSVQMHFENSSIAVIPHRTDQPILDGHEPCLQRRHEMPTVYRKSPTIRTQVGSRIVMQ